MSAMYDGEVRETEHTDRETWFHRNTWIPSVDVQAIEYIGREWPDVLVTRWETNYTGERRLVDSLIYSPPAPVTSTR